MGYARPRLRDSESNLRFVVVLDENDFQLKSEQNNSNFVTYELSPGLYTIKKCSQAVYTLDDHEGTLNTENDDSTLKTKPILTRFG